MRRPRPSAMSLTLWSESKEARRAKLGAAPAARRRRGLATASGFDVPSPIAPNPKSAPRLDVALYNDNIQLSR